MCKNDLFIVGVDLTAEVDGPEPHGQPGARHDQRGRRGRLRGRGVRGVCPVHHETHEEHRSGERGQGSLQKVS